MYNEMFHNPSSMYRPAPLWVWNDLMNKNLIMYQLSELKKQGFGGAFVHPRPGLITEYLSDEWFKHWGEALEIAKEMDMKLYIYDENSYPSGFAGGHVPSQLPDCLASSVVMKEHTKETIKHLPLNKSLMLNNPGHPISAFSYIEVEKGKSIEITNNLTDIPVDEWSNYGDHYLLFELGKPETNAWHGGFAYVDLLRPEVAQVFIETTYEPYKEKFGQDFGDAIPAIFTDEPAVSPGNLFETIKNVLPFSYWFASQFEDMNGYDLKDYLPSLFFETKWSNSSFTSEKVRYDYYHTVHELWVKNFVKPLSNWCEQNEIAFTGHYLEHNFPYPWGLSSPSIMSMYEYMHWPAIDMLMAHLLLKDGTEPLLMLTIKEAQSVANQFNKERVLCETYGAGGWDSNFEDYKRIGDWLYVHGINFLNQHLTFSTIVGARKRDHPQSFDWRQAWWDEYKELNDYYSRLSYSLSQGETNNNLLVIQPTTSYYLQSPKTTNTVTWERDIKYLSFVQELVDSQVEFDLGDEYIIRNHSEVKEKTFWVNKKGYQLVIVPPNMDNLMQSTMHAIDSFLHEGGTIISLSEPKYVEGVISDELEQLTHHPNWIKLKSVLGLFDYLEEHSLLKFKISLNNGVLPKGIAHLSKTNDDGSVTYFIVNSSQVDVSELTIQMNGEYVEQLNPWTGEVQPITYTRNGNELWITSSLPGVGSLLLKVYPHPINSVKTDAQINVGKGNRELIHSQTSITPEKENFLVLDYVDLHIGNKTYQDIHVLHAQKVIFEYHGFEMNPWDNAVQFKRRLLDRQSQLDQLIRSGFSATYHFEVKENAISKQIKVLVERPELYEIAINGNKVTFSDASALDHYIKEADISDFMKAGTNTVSVSASKFHIFMELEPIYIMGDFGVGECEGKWCMEKQQKLGIGSWKEQGYPFYPYAVQYQKSFDLKNNHKKIFVKLNKWQGTAASIIVNDENVGVIIKSGESKEITSYLKQGTNNVAVRVSGSMRNLLGPHHDPSIPRKTAWPGNWKKTPRYGNASPETYDLIDGGLLEDFEITWRNN